MSKVCIVTGKRPATGNNVSHAQNKTKEDSYQIFMHTDFG